MKNKIYKEVYDVINSYNTCKKSLIFTLIKENLGNFNKEVISNQLTAKLNEVLIDLKHPNFKRLEDPLFSNPAILDLIEEFSEFLVYRYQFDDFFKYAYHPDWSAEKLKDIAIKDFRIFKTRFLDSQVKYFYGYLNVQENNSYVIGIPEGHIKIHGTNGSIAYGSLQGASRKEFIKKIAETKSTNFACFGRLIFDESMGVNVINIFKVIFD